MEKVSNIVFASYREVYAFQLPDGMDLNDKTKVKFWGVKHNRLHIHLVDGTELEFGYTWQQDTDYRRPNEIELSEPPDE
jgi:hypothetical protein